MKKNLFIVGGIVFLILLLDQVLKILVKTHTIPTQALIGDWFYLEYTENQGMAFGTTFGSTVWHKLALSIFRVIAVGGICYYWYKQATEGAKTEFLIVIGLILAGATGNLIDSMFYDFIFPFDPCLPFNHLNSTYIYSCDEPVRHTGFLLGNVVDMFKFQAYWPEWMPWVGGNEVFPAIWNIADASISIGVVMVFIRQKAYFPKREGQEKSESKTVADQISESEN